MLKPREISRWDWPDETCIQDGYETSTIPSATPKNMKYMMDRYNELAAVVLVMADRLGIAMECNCQHIYCEECNERKAE